MLALAHSRTSSSDSLAKMSSRKTSSPIWRVTASPAVRRMVSSFLKTVPLAAEREFPKFDNDSKTAEPKSRCAQRKPELASARSFASSAERALKKQTPGRFPAPGDFIRDDEVLEVDESCDDQQCEKDPVNRRQRKAVANPRRTNSTAVRSSTRGTERKFSPAAEHFPARGTSLTGTFSRQGIARWQSGQNERRGLLSGMPRGNAINAGIQEGTHDSADHRREDGKDCPLIPPQVPPPTISQRT